MTVTQPCLPRRRPRQRRQAKPGRHDLLPQDYPPTALDNRYPVRTRQPPSPVRTDLARGNEMAQSQNTSAFTNVCAHSFATVRDCMFSTKFRPTAVAMPTRHKALKTPMRNITNTDTVLNHIRTGLIALVRTHNGDLITKRQWGQGTHMVMAQY